MRIKGTKYPEVKKLPSGAVPVSKYAFDNEMQVGHVYMKYKRHYEPMEGKAAGPKPDYIIRCWMGANFVIPIS